jgi:hypothetical protein
MEVSRFLILFEILIASFDRIDEKYQPLTYHRFRLYYGQR